MIVEAPPVQHGAAAFTEEDIFEDYQAARKQVRHFSPDIGKRRFETLNEVNDDNVKDDKLVLMEDEEDNQSRLEFEPQPKFKSAKNSPYTQRER